VCDVQQLQLLLLLLVLWRCLVLDPCIAAVRCSAGFTWLYHIVPCLCCSNTLLSHFTVPLSLTCRNLSITGASQTLATPQLFLPPNHKLDLCRTCTLQLTGISIMFEQQDPKQAAVAAAGGSNHLSPGALAAAVVVPVLAAGATC
jgi:hypothetical protein